MARDYAIVTPQFWTGTTGREIRARGRDVQLVALYLMTSPHANMLGLYYLPLPYLSHETGIPLEGASKALRSLGEVGFAFYDERDEVVWLPEMARYQIGEALKAADKRVQGVVNELTRYRKSRYYEPFLKRYAVPFNLPAMPPAVPIAVSAPEAPSSPPRSQDQDQDQDHDQEHEHDQEKLAPSPAAPAPPLAPVVERAPKQAKKASNESVEPLRLRLIEFIRSTGTEYIDVSVVAERTNLRRALAAGATEGGIETAFRSVYARGGWHPRVQDVARVLTSASEKRGSVARSGPPTDFTNPDAYQDVSLAGGR